MYKFKKMIHHNYVHIFLWYEERVININSMTTSEILEYLYSGRGFGKYKIVC